MISPHQNLQLRSIQLHQHLNCKESTLIQGLDSRNRGVAVTGAVFVQVLARDDQGITFILVGPAGTSASDES